MSSSRMITALPRTTIAVIGVMLIVGTIILPARAQVPTPTVTGPIPSLDPPGLPSHNYPQMASAPMYDLSRLGYIEEEFFFSGTARSYSTPTLADGVVLSSGHPYKTRLIVRRPSDPGKFNGIVIVEWVNVTSGYNLDLHKDLTRLSDSIRLCVRRCVGATCRCTAGTLRTHRMESSAIRHP
jgi:hypothetical protein